MTRNRCGTSSFRSVTNVRPAINGGAMPKRKYFTGGRRPARRICCPRQCVEQSAGVRKNRTGSVDQTGTPAFRRENSKNPLCKRHGNANHSDTDNPAGGDSTNAFRACPTRQCASPRFAKPPAPRPASWFSENLLCQTILHVFEMRTHPAKKLSTPFLNSNERYFQQIQSPCREV